MWEGRRKGGRDGGMEGGSERGREGGKEKEKREGGTIRYFQFVPPEIIISCNDTKYENMYVLKMFSRGYLLEYMVYMYMAFECTMQETA